MPLNKGVRMEQSLSASRMAAEHRAGARDPADSVAASLARAHRSQGRFNPFACLDDDAAMAAAGRVGDLAGVPVSVKDILDVAGLPTRFGSPLMAHASPAAADIIAVQRLRAAGAVVIGKTTTTEFAWSAIGASPLTGLTVNPWAPGLTCGGSSLGAGVSVALGVTPIALATDAGCSTRLPAACTGTFGLKPTLGTIPHERVPDGFGNFIHLGLLACDVDDLAFVLPVIAGPDPRDPHSLFRPPLTAQPARLHGARILLWPRCGNARVGAEIAANLARVAAILRDLGADIIEAEYQLPHPDPIWRTLQQLNWASRFAAASARDRAMLSDGFNAGIDAGAASSGLDVARAAAGRTAIFRGVQAQFNDGVDFILTPCTATAAVAAELDPAAPLLIDGTDGGNLRADWTPYLSLFDLSGHPAISIPSGIAESGAPIGVQLVGGFGEDMRLLAAASALANVMPPPRFSMFEEMDAGR